MNRLLLSLLLCLCLLSQSPGTATAQEDLRVRYGTDDLTAAREVHRGMTLVNSGKVRDAISAFQAAIKADPKCGFAHFQLALSFGDIGEIENAVVAYKAIFAKDARSGRNVRATAATNLAILHGKLGEFDESNLWFSKAIVEDYDNTFKERGKAYRNMALNLRSQKKHLAAAVAMALAYEDKAKNCDLAAVRDFFKQVTDAEDSCKLLHFDDQTPEVKPRKEAIELKAVTVAKVPTDAISDFLPDPAGKYVVALSPTAGRYHVVVLGATPTVRSIDAKGLVAACLMEGKLFLSRTEPNRVDHIELDSGKVLKSYAIPKVAPKSFTVFPTQNRLYFSFNDTVHDLDMLNGEARETNTPGTVVHGHPNQKYVFSFYRPLREGSSGLVVIDGHVYETRRGFDWLQSPLFKSVATPGGLLLAEVRDNAASNGQRLAMSPDGNWVGVVGGGGYRPSDKAEGGYGVAIFGAMNTEKVQGFFKTDAHPQGMCINPASKVVVTVGANDCHCYHLGDAKTDVKVGKGNWNGACTWSGDGKILLVAHGKGGGFSAFSMALTREEEKIGADWPTKITVTPMAVTKRPAAAIPELANFSVPEAATVETVRKALDRAEKKGRTVVLTHWANHPDYEKNKQATDDIANAIQALRGNKAEDMGIALIRLQRADKATPNHPPLLFFIGELNSRRGKKDEAEKFFLSAVRGDLGRSDVTPLALTGLSQLYGSKSQQHRAVHCLLAALEVDRADPKMIARAAEALTALKMEPEAARVRKFASATGPTGNTPLAEVKDLPPLAVLKDGKKLASEDLYAKSVTSVVVIRTASGSGSGFCVGRGDIVVTNAHVAEGQDEVTIVTYKLTGKKLERNAELKGTVVYYSAEADLAVVKLEKEVLTPLRVSAESPAAGAKVFALGSPGLGRDILEQSISEGLVSSRERKVDGKVLIQHSAAVNPGNSGGPLLDEFGAVVGVVTSKAKLENVGFAIPVETFRRLFPAGKK